VFSLLAVPLFWIMIDKDNAGFEYGVMWFGVLANDSFFMQHKGTAFVVYLVILLLELGPLLWLAYRTTTKRILSRALGISSVTYLISIFFIYFFSDNYCMRGAVIPIFTLTYVATPEAYAMFKNHGRRWYAALLIPYFLGGLYEYGSFALRSTREFRSSDTAFNVAALRSNSDPAPFADERLVQASSQLEWGWYLLEKRKAHAKASLTHAEAATFHGDSKYRVTLRSLCNRWKRNDH
jgi:hypothetical protein